MNKKEIIKILNEEVGLFLETEDEDSLGNLYISEKQFKDTEEVLKKLLEKKDSIADYEAKLRDIIESDKRFNVIRGEHSFNDMIILKKLYKPYICIDSHLLFSSCSFFGKELVD
jgi:hypothetical protein